jgi:hypothetical protein
MVKIWIITFKIDLRRVGGLGCEGVDWFHLTKGKAERQSFARGGE